MTPCRPLWKRLLRRPVLTTARGVEMAASLAFISPLYQMPQALRLGRAAAPAPPVRTALVVNAY